MHVGVVGLRTNLDHVLDLANALDNLGLTASLYLSAETVARSVEDTTAPVEYLYRNALLNPGIRARLFHLRRMRDPRSLNDMRRISRAMQGDSIDVAHLVMGGGEFWIAVLARLLRGAGIPVAANMVIPEPNMGEYPPASAVRAANWLLARWSPVLIVNGRSQVARTAKRYRFPETRIQYIPLGPFLAFLPWRDESMAEVPGLVLFFGRANAHKGLDYLLRAHSIVRQSVPQAQTVVVGHGPEIARCRAEFGDIPHVELHDGFVTAREAAAWFQKAALVVLPYLSASTSGVLMIAYAFGKPVVATRVGCLPEYVRDGVTGTLVSPGDPDKLAGAISVMLQDDETRRAMGRNAQAWIEDELSWPNIARQTLQAYELARSVCGVGEQTGAETP